MGAAENAARARREAAEKAKTEQFAPSIAELEQLVPAALQNLKRHGYPAVGQYRKDTTFRWEGEPVVSWQLLDYRVGGDNFNIYLLSNGVIVGPSQGQQFGDETYDPMYRELSVLLQVIQALKYIISSDFKSAPIRDHRAY